MESETTEMGFYSVFFNEEIYTNVLISDKIKNNIMDDVVKETKQPENNSQVISFTGGYEKKVLIIIENNTELDDQDKEFLSNVLNAVKLEYKDIAIINIANDKSLKLNKILSELKPEKIFGFGLNALFTENNRVNVKTFVNKSPALFMSYSLKDISQNLDFKKILWSNLKKIFF